MLLSGIDVMKYRLSVLGIGICVFGLNFVLCMCRLIFWLLNWNVSWFVLKVLSCICSILV